MDYFTNKYIYILNILYNTYDKIDSSRIKRRGMIEKFKFEQQDKWLCKWLNETLNKYTNK